MFRFQKELVVHSGSASAKQDLGILPRPFLLFMGVFMVGRKDRGNWSRTNRGPAPLNAVRLLSLD